jgi:hypothetical protein
MPGLLSTIIPRGVYDKVGDGRGAPENTGTCPGEHLLRPPRTAARPGQPGPGPRHAHPSRACLPAGAAVPGGGAAEPLARVPATADPPATTGFLAVDPHTTARTAHLVQVVHIDETGKTLGTWLPARLLHPAAPPARHLNPPAPQRHRAGNRRHRPGARKGQAPPRTADSPDIWLCRDLHLCNDASSCRAVFPPWPRHAPGPGTDPQDVPRRRSPCRPPFGRGFAVPPARSTGWSPFRGRSPFGRGGPPPANPGRFGRGSGRAGASG